MYISVLSEFEINVLKEHEMILGRRQGEDSLLFSSAIKTFYSVTKFQEYGFPQSKEAQKSTWEVNYNTVRPVLNNTAERIIASI